jgi:heat shock protein 5
MKDYLILLCCALVLVRATVIGIDLGTTYSAVAVFKHGRAEIIANGQGARTTPSWIAFDEKIGEQLVGEAAKNQAILNPVNTVFDIKRVIGRRFEDEAVQKDVKSMPYRIVKGVNEGPAVEIKGRLYTPEELSAFILRRLKEAAEAYLGENITRAVITVPAYFNDAQRQATKDAGALAGLTVERLISEPTAAAIAYGHDHPTPKGEERRIVVFDFGGGTLDVTVLSIEDGVFEVTSTSGDTRLGGEDLDARLTEHLLKQFERKTGLDARGDKRAVQRVKREAERVKQLLSTQMQVQVELELFYEGQDLSEKVTRAKFEDLVGDILRRTLDPVRRALEDAKLKKDQVHEVLLVGGSTRIPKVQALLQEYFGRAPSKGVNPDEAVAMGAAIEGALLAGDPELQEGMTVLDVTPLSMGIETVGGIMTVLVARNSHIPTTATNTFSTANDNQERVEVRVYQGERPLVKDCELLGTFMLTGIAPAPRGTPQIKVTFSIDVNSILVVRAVEQNSGQAQEMRIESNKGGRLTQEEINRLLEEAEAFKQEDTIKRERIEARNSFEGYINEVKRTAKEKLKGESATVVGDEVARAVEWLENTPNASKEEIDARRKTFLESVQPHLIATPPRTDEL